VCVIVPVVVRVLGLEAAAKTTDAELVPRPVLPRAGLESATDPFMPYGAGMADGLIAGGGPWAVGMAIDGNCLGEWTLAGPLI
jgi:hypothetical protein